MENKQADIEGLLLKIAEDNDEKAFSIFFERYHAKLLRFAHVYVQSMQEAEDVVSETLTGMLRNRKEAFLKDNFVNYLFKAVKNKCLDHLRRENRKQKILDINYDELDYFIQDSHTPFSQVAFDELFHLMHKRIEKLPPKRKLVFKFIKEDGLTYKQTAQLMNISERTVEVHLKLAIKELRESLEIYKSNKVNEHSAGISTLIMLVFSIFNS